jgi:hypothetical protein
MLNHRQGHGDVLWQKGRTLEALDR